jgi:hypothetical protein
MKDDFSNSTPELASPLDALEPLSATAPDPVIEVFMRNVDFTLVERNLRLTVAQRAQQLANAADFLRTFRPLVDGKHP